MSLYSSLTQVLAPFAAKINGLLTGWNGTRYNTPGEAVRQQIADLHVLIGDEPGTAIQASAVAYGDSDVGTELTNVNGRLDELSGGMSDEAKHALLACFEHVAWTTPNGQEYYDALELALFPPAELESISAVYTQSGTVYTSDTLDSLKADLVVTAHYSGSTSEVVSNYTLSGTLTAGTSTITVSYGSKLTTFTVTVTNDNLFDPTNVDLSNFWAAGRTGGYKVSNSNYPTIVGVNTRIPVEPSTTYVLSHNKPSDLVCFFSEGGSYIGSVTGAATSDPTETKTFTTPSNCASLAFNINTSVIPIEDVYLILKRG